MNVFLIDQYPDKVTCRAMPGVNDTSIEVTIFGTDADITLSNVPKEAVRLLPRPRLSQEILESDPLFNAMLGLGLLACRVIDTSAHDATIEVPTTDSSYMVVVPLNQIPRKR